MPQMHACTDNHTLAHTIRTHTHTHAHTHAHAHTRTHTYTHTRTRTHTHVHVYTELFRPHVRKYNYKHSHGSTIEQDRAQKSTNTTKASSSFSQLPGDRRPIHTHAMASHPQTDTHSNTSFASHTGAHNKAANFSNENTQKYLNLAGSYGDGCSRGEPTDHRWWDEINNESCTSRHNGT